MKIRQALELASLTLGHGLLHWEYSAFYLILPFITQDFSLSLTEAGLLITYRTLISSLFNLPAGAINDALGGRRLVLGLSILVSSLAFFGIGLSDSYILLQSAITIVGIANVLWHPGAVSTLTERFSNRKGFGLSFHEFGATIGEAVAPIVIGIALLHLNWRVIAQLHLLPGVLIAISLWLFVVDLKRPRERKEGQPSYWAGLRRLISNRQSLAIDFVSGTRSMAQVIISTFLPIYLILGIGYSSDTAGFYVGLLTIPAVISGLIVGPLSDRLGRKPVIRFGLTLSTVMFISLALTRSGFLFAASLVVLGLFLFSMRPVLQAYIVELAPAGMSGTAIAMQFFINTLLGAAAPVVAGFLADQVRVSSDVQTGLLSTFFLAAGVVFVGDMIALLVTRESKATATSVAEPVPQSSARR